MIIERLKRPIEKNMCITKGSTPIIYFGNYEKSKACTISLNPSSREFHDKDGNILIGHKERLCSRIKLGKKDNEPLTDNDVEIVLKYCKNYFKINPYKNWFNKFDYIIKNFGYSYYNDTCVNLDLVQWATTPFWDKVDEKIKNIHLNNDLPVLEYLLKKDFEYIFLNGSTVVSNIIKHLKVNISEKDLIFENINGNKINIKLYAGEYINIKIIGWSIYLQSPAIGGYDNIDILYNTIKKAL